MIYLHERFTNAAFDSKRIRVIFFAFTLHYEIPAFALIGHALLTHILGPLHPASYLHESNWST